jgi:hypothetical protein
MRTVEDAYKESLKVEEKLSRKRNHKNKGKNPTRGKGTTRENF